MNTSSVPRALVSQSARPGLTWAGIAASAVGLMLALAAPASAADPASAGSTVYSTAHSGYMVSGRWFRFIRTEVRLPSDALCAQLARVVAPGSFSVNAGLGAPPLEASQLIVTDHPSSGGCGTFTAKFVVNSAAAPADLLMSPGDTITLSVFFDQASHQSTATLEDLTSGHAVIIAASAGTPIYATAHVLAGFSQFTAPAEQFRAFAFTGSAATTYTGVRGTLTGPWTTSQVVMTSNGTSTGTVEASNPVLWDGGANFGTWVRAD